uniref:Uncharacterized protein n=7 Tax=Avena sativa TaxID=4498 RepID=A0ACD5Z999_AVESA
MPTQPVHSASQARPLPLPFFGPSTPSLTESQTRARNRLGSRNPLRVDPTRHRPTPASRVRTCPRRNETPHATRPVPFPLYLGLRKSAVRTAPPTQTTAACVSLLAPPKFPSRGPALPESTPPILVGILEPSRRPAGRPSMDAAAGDAGERGRSWYLSKEEIERGSPSRRDGVAAAKEAQLRATYSSFIRDVGLRLRLPQITIATGIVLCHRFYLHQSHAKNEWQTVATVCVFLASKIEDTPCQLDRVVIASHETMYKKNPVAARRISQKGILEKRKALILVGEALLLSTIRYDFNIQHPYEPLKVALKNLGISQKEVKQAAINLINDTLRTTLVVQFKPHYIAAGSLSLAARFHNVRLPTEKGKIWWHQFDVAPKLLEAAIQQMKELFLKRNPLPTSPAIQLTAAQTPLEKQQIQTPVEKQQIQTLVEKQQIHTLVEKQQIQSPVEKQQIHAPVDKQQIQTPVEKQQIDAPVDKQQIQTPVVKQQIQTPVVKQEMQTLLEKQQIISTTSAIRPIPAQTQVEKQQTRSMAPAVRPIPAQTLAEKQQKISKTPAIRPVPARTPVEKQQIISMTPAIRPTSAQPPVEKQQIISTTPAIWPTSAQPPVEKQQIISTTTAIQPTSAQPPVEKQQLISFPKPVLKYTYSRRGLERPAAAPIPSPTLVEKQEIIRTVDPVPGQQHSTRGGVSRPTTATATTLTTAPVKKQKIRSTPDSVLGHTQSLVVGAMPTKTPARASSPVRNQQIISTQDSVLRHTHSSAEGERRPAPAPAPVRARTPVRKQQIISTQVPVLRNTQPSAECERRSTTAPARPLVRKQQIISTPDSLLRHTNHSVGGERKPTTAPGPARARTPVRKQQKLSSTQVSALRHTQPSVEGERSATAPARSPVRKEQIISTPDSVLRHTNPSQRGLTSNNFDRHASSMRVDSSVHQDSTGSPARNEVRKPLRMHVDHRLSETAKDGRPLTLRAALRADHVYHVRSGPEDVNMTRVSNLVSKKRKIQEGGEHPSLVNKPDGDAWTRPRIRSVIVAPPSWKKQKF